MKGFCKAFTALLMITASHDAMAALAIDGGVSAAATTVTYSNSDTQDVVVVEITSSAAAAGTVASIADTAGLTWAKAPVNGSLSQGTLGNSNYFNTEIWWAYSPAKLTSDVITPTMSTGVPARVSAFGVNGANTAAPFDTNASLIATQANNSSAAASVTISTSNANDLLFTYEAGLSTTGLSRPTGFTQVVATGSSTDIAYEIVSSTQGSVVEAYSWTGGKQEQLHVGCHRGGVTSCAFPGTRPGSGPLARSCPGTISCPARACAITTAPISCPGIFAKHGFLKHLGYLPMKNMLRATLAIALISSPALAEISTPKNASKAGSQVAFRKTAPLEVRNLAGEQVLLITADGKFMAHGKYIATDKEAVKIMIKYLHDEKCSTK